MSGSFQNSQSSTPSTKALAASAQKRWSAPRSPGSFGAGCVQRGASWNIPETAAPRSRKRVAVARLREKSGGALDKGCATCHLSRSRTWRKPQRRTRSATVRSVSPSFQGQRKAPGREIQAEAVSTAKALEASSQSTVTSDECRVTSGETTARVARFWGGAASGRAPSSARLEAATPIIR